MFRQSILNLISFHLSRFLGQRRSSTSPDKHCPITSVRNRDKVVDIKARSQQHNLSLRSDSLAPVQITIDNIIVDESVKDLTMNDVDDISPLRPSSVCHVKSKDPSNISESIVGKTNDSGIFIQAKYNPCRGASVV